MANDNTPLVNGKAYDYVDIAVTIAGVPVKGISSISYTEEREIANNYGTGSRPVSQGAGPIDATASFEIDANEIYAIRQAAPGKSLLRIANFDITVSFLNEQGFTTDVIKNCRFMNDGVETSQGDTNVKRTFDFKPSHILFDA